MLGVFYSNVEEDKHNNCPLKRKQTSTLYTNQNFIKRQKTIFNIVLFTVLHLLLTRWWDRDSSMMWRDIERNKETEETCAKTKRSIAYAVLDW